MVDIVESIKQVNEGTNHWSVVDSFEFPHQLAKFNAPNAAYLWVYEEGTTIGFVSLKDIKSGFEDNDLMDEFEPITRLGIGDSYSPDGMNIYIRLH